MPKTSTLPYRPCVGVMLVNRQGLVWIGKREDDKHGVEASYAWQMPQGGIDSGESPLKAAKRELYEETSVRTVTLIGEAPDWYNYDFPPEILARTRRSKFRGQTQRWFAFRFDGDDDEINIRTPPDGHRPEFHEWRWERASALPELIIPFKRPVYENVVRAFRHLTNNDDQPRNVGV